MRSGLCILIVSKRKTEIFDFRTRTLEDNSISPISLSILIRFVRSKLIYDRYNNSIQIIQIDYAEMWYRNLRFSHCYLPWEYLYVFQPYISEFSLVLYDSNTFLIAILMHSIQCIFKSLTMRQALTQLSFRDGCCTWPSNDVESNDHVDNSTIKMGSRCLPLRRHPFFYLELLDNGTANFPETLQVCSPHV